VRQLAAAFVSQHHIAAKAQASLRTPRSLLFSEQSFMGFMAHPETRENRFVFLSGSGSESESVSAFCFIDPDSDTDSDPEVFSSCVYFRSSRN